MMMMMMMMVVVAEPSQRRVRVMVRLNRRRIRRVGGLLGGVRGALSPLRVGAGSLRGALGGVGGGLRLLRGRGGRLRRACGGVRRALSVFSRALSMVGRALRPFYGVSGGAAANGQKTSHQADQRNLAC
jgi:hypothetical protein